MFVNVEASPGPSGNAKLRFIHYLADTVDGILSSRACIDDTASYPIQALCKNEDKLKESHIVL